MNEWIVIIGFSLFAAWPLLAMWLTRDKKNKGEK